MTTLAFRRNKYMWALVALALLTVLVVAVVLLSAVGHIPVAHMVGSVLTPLYSFGHG